MTCRELDEYICWLDGVRRLQPLTVLDYRRTLETLVEQIDWKETSTPGLEGFIHRERENGRPPRPATAAKERHAVRGFYRWCHARGYLATDPSLEIAAPKVRNRTPKAVDDATWRTLWSSTENVEDRIWLGLGFFVGLRRSELAQMPVDVVDVERQCFVGLERKGGVNADVEYGDLARIYEAKLPLLIGDADEWLDQVAWLRTAREGERFFATWSQGVNPGNDGGWVNKRMRTLLRRAGLPSNVMTPHSLRHSCATNLLRVGVPIELIADQLSHSSLDTTRRYLATSGMIRRWTETEGVAR